MVVKNLNCIFVPCEAPSDINKKKNNFLMVFIIHDVYPKPNTLFPKNFLFSYQKKKREK